ncbi:cysteine desulfurase family protein [Tenacibaculum jejuense]|uniref:cysteine desulfurase n=1 Tax=Tenacibaculum jejuense TaxID=584609 RepID=A0A238U811_9FLAO|nr:cysteine desulfurase family protein [Tenacibaculum jejuense]SNR15232.1 cysteine desulfurase [Tenacibaculum jejuense]
MKKVYFDNAATTPILKEVVDVMAKSMIENYGNPSSIHEVGRKAKVQLETARKKMASLLNANSNEIVFTSGGTEGNNLVLRNAVENLKVKRIITSKIEHHAVLDVLLELKKEYDFQLDFVGLNDKGEVDLNDLIDKLSSTDSLTLVSLMWVNNELGNILPVEKVGEICKNHKALFHTDAVQAVGHFQIDLKAVNVDFLVASAHKFHGPNGVGFVFVKKDVTVKPIIHGGGQEKGKRSGTEDIHAVLGMQKALEISLTDLGEKAKLISGVKEYFIGLLTDNFPDVKFNGLSSIPEKSSYTILNVRFPIENKMLLFNLDLNGVFVSGGSACQSGASKKSHVLKEILNNEEISKSSVRFSFSKFSDKEEVEFVIEKLKKVI